MASPLPLPLTMFRQRPASRALLHNVISRPTAVPRRSLPFHPAARRAASSSSPSSSSSSSSTKAAHSSGRVLEKPAKYVPPSHPPRLKSGKRYQYGGELTPAMKAAQSTKQYPHMMPPEGTFMHWFLTARWLHAVIATSGLAICAGIVFTLEFRRRTPYLDRLPSWGELGRHPVRAIRQAVAVYQDHVDWQSQQTQQKRDKDVEDARKRKAYRVAHGLERPEHGLQGDVPGVHVSFAEKAEIQEEAEFERKVKKAYRDAIVKAGGSPEVMDAYKEGREKPKELKKWFGIW